MDLQRCRRVTDRRQGRGEGKMQRIRFKLSAHGIFLPAIWIERHEDSGR